MKKENLPLFGMMYAAMFISVPLLVLLPQTWPVIASVDAFCLAAGVSFIARDVRKNPGKYMRGSALNPFTLPVMSRGVKRIFFLLSLVTAVLTYYTLMIYPGIPAKGNEWIVFILYEFTFFASTVFFRDIVLHIWEFREMKAKIEEFLSEGG